MLLLLVTLPVYAAYSPLTSDGTCIDGAVATLTEDGIDCVSISCPSGQSFSSLSGGIPQCLSVAAAGGSKWDVSGNYVIPKNSKSVKAPGFFYTSDERLKEKVGDGAIKNPLQSLIQLNGYRFTFKDDSEKTVKVGLFAQEVEAVFPEVVSTDTTSDAVKSVDYAALVPVLIEGIKELSERYDSLTEVVTQQQEEITNLRALLE